MNRATGWLFSGWLAVCAAAVSGQAPVSPEMQVNPNHAGDQHNPSVAIGQDGGGLIAYSGDQDVRKKVRRFDVHGRPVGDLGYLEVPLGEGGAAVENLVLDRSGSGLACWSDAHEIFCRPIDSSSGINGDTHSVTPGSTANLGAAVDLFPDGSGIVAWLALHEDEPGNLLATGFWKLVTAEGAPMSAPHELATFQVGLGATIDVSALGEDRAVVVWTGFGQDDSESGVRGEIVDRGGSPIGLDFPVNSYTADRQEHSRVEADERGNFVVVWQSNYQDGSAGGIYGQRFDRSGNRLGAEFQISSDASSDQVAPDVAMDAAGNFVVVFYSTYESVDSAEDTFLRAYRWDGSPNGQQVLVNEQIIYPQEHPKVALSDSGLVQVAYQSWRNPPGDPGWTFDLDIMTRRFVLPCLPDDTALCLEGGRFQVRAFWKDFSARDGLAKTVPLTGESGGFWFFRPGILELLVKVVDGCGTNGRFWIYSAGLTNLDVDLLVTDTWTGQVEVFQNALGLPYSPVQAIDLFDSCPAPGGLPGSTLVPGRAPALEPTPGAEAQVPSSEPSALTGIQPPGGCVPSPGELCLQNGRFRVTATWGDFTGGEGTATGVPFGDDSGLFWFFDDQNLELAIKVIDACSFNDRFWIYAAGLTNLAITLQVEDTQHDVGWEHSNILGAPFPPVLDSSAFDTCP